MKIYIIADMEGIGGIFLPEQLSRGTAEYAEARHWLTGEVNAAIAGAFDGGATDVIVRDAHSSGFNFVYGDIDERVEIVGGGSFPDRFSGLDASVRGVFLIGYHAKAGTQSAICDHTMSSVSWTRYELCGDEVGETGIDAAIAGARGVPVIMVSGDDKLCAEARGLLGENLTTCCTKQGLTRHAVRTKSPRACRKLIYEAAREAVMRPEWPKPYRPDPPYEVKLTYVMTTGADARHFDENTIRLDGRTVLFQGSSLEEVVSKSLR